MREGLIIMAVAATFAIGFLVGAWELIGRYW